MSSVLYSPGDNSLNKDSVTRGIDTDSDLSFLYSGISEPLSLYGGTTAKLTRLELVADSGGAELHNVCVCVGAVNKNIYKEVC